MTHLFHPRRSFHRSLCVVLAGLMAVSPAPLLAQAPDEATPIDVSYVLPNACALFALRPAQILNAPAVEMFPIEVLQAAAIQEVGLDPLAAEQVMVSVLPPAQGPPAYAVVATFSAPAQLKAGEATQHTQPGSLRGTPYLQSGHPTLPSFFQPDPNTIVAAPDAALQALSTADRAAGPADSLEAKFLAASQGDDLLVMVDVEPLRPLINMGLMEALLPPQLAQLREIPNLLKTIQLRVNLSRPGLTELVAWANNEADALKLVQMFDSVKQLMADQSGAAAAVMLASDDPVEQAGGRYIQRMSKLTDERLQLVHEGEQLVLVRTNVHSEGGAPMFGVATIGVLVALLLPAIQAAREAARRNSSLNNMKQILIGIANYESAKLKFPAHAIYSDDGEPLLSWRVAILPYMEHMALYNQFHLDEPWDSEHNRTLIAQMPDVYFDPSSEQMSGDGKSNYVGVAGEGMFFDGTSEGRTHASIANGDGTSNTICILQVDDENAVIWTKPDDWEVDANAPLAGIGSLHAGGFLAGYCDTHSRFINSLIDPDVFRALLTVDGGEAIDGAQ